jgi:hypothetical protein
VREQGMAILEDMTSISEEEPLPIIRAYIDLNLLTLHQVLPTAKHTTPICAC